MNSIDANELIRIKRGAKLNAIFISDVHLGHPRTPTKHILTVLDQIFEDNDFLKSLDFIGISGDFFDLLLDFASEETILIRAWVAKFLRKCKKYGIVVRVLKGTSYHDWDQPILFIEENENHDIGCDLRYVRDVSIEHIEKLNLDFLYVPDEANPTSAQTWEEVQKCLREANLTQVDYAMMHGAMKYHLSGLADVEHILHDPELYLKITRHYVNIGHIHQASKHDRILTNGSTDRLVHGDEGDKGHWRLINGKPHFIVNHRAMRYKTIDVIGDDAAIVLQKVAEYLGDDRNKCSVRLLCEKKDVATEMFRRLTDIFPFCRFEYKSPKVAKKVEVTVDLTKPAARLPTLTEANIVDELMKEMATKYSDLDYDGSRALAEKLLHAVTQ